MGIRKLRDHFTEASGLLETFCADESNFNRMAEAGQMISAACTAGFKVIACGNGGSMCDAMHFCEEFTGRFRENRKPLAAIAVSDPAYLSCTANDFGYDEVFARYVEAVGKPGDVLLAISTSGRSANVLKAATKAREMGIGVIALTGKDGGDLAALADVGIRAPYSEHADFTQEIHIKVLHALIEFVECNL